MQFVGTSGRVRRPDSAPGQNGGHGGTVATPRELDPLVERLRHRLDDSTCVAVKRGEEWTHLLADEGLVVKVRTGRMARRHPVSREFAVHRALHAAGVAVPEPLTFHEPRRDAAVDRQYLVVRALPVDRSARELLRHDRPPRCRLMQVELAGRIAELHEAGWVHGDLNLKNVLVGDEATPYLIDLDHTFRPWRGFRSLMQMRDLRDVWISLRRTPATSDFELLFETYAARRGFGAERSRRWERLITLVPKKRELIGRSAEILRPDPAA